jgi:hypothetical protein
MIRLTALLHRNHALSSEQFQAHWGSTHAELVRSLPRIDEWVTRYEQHPRLHAPGQWTGSQGFDGITVQWFHDIESFAAMTQDIDYRQKVAPDERQLLDMTRSVFLVTAEPRVIIEGPDELLL